MLHESRFAGRLSTEADTRVAMGEVGILEEVDTFWRESVLSSALCLFRKLSRLLRYASEWTIASFEVRALN